MSRCWLNGPAHGTERAAHVCRAGQTLVLRPAWVPHAVLHGTLGHFWAVSNVPTHGVPCLPQISFVLAGVKRMRNVGYWNLVAARVPLTPLMNEVRQGAFADLNLVTTALLNNVIGCASCEQRAITCTTPCPRTAVAGWTGRTWKASAKWFIKVHIGNATCSSEEAALARRLSSVPWGSGSGSWDAVVIHPYVRPLPSIRGIWFRASAIHILTMEL